MMKLLNYIIAGILSPFIFLGIFIWPKVENMWIKGGWRRGVLIALAPILGPFWVLCFLGGKIWEKVT